MADLDTLNIQISASSAKADRAIDALIGHLGKLEDALNHYSDDSNYVRGLNNLTTGLVGMSDALSNIDVAKIKDMASAFHSLANAGAKIATLNANLTSISKQGGGANPFEGLVNGLTSLNGLSITADQFGGLKPLSETLGKLGGTYAQNASVALPQIAEGLRMISSVDIPDVGEQLANLGAGISRLGSKAATRAQGLPQVAEGLRQLAALPAIPQLEGLDSLAASLSMFGRKTATTAITNIPQLATAFRSLIDVLSKAPNVSQNTIDFANALAAVTANGAGATRQLTTLTGRTNLFSKSAGKAAKKTHSLASTFGKLYASYWLVIRAIKGLGTAIEYSSSLTEVENVVNTTFTNATDKVQEFADDAIMSFGMSELAAKQFASRFQAMGSAMGITTEQVGKASEYLVGVIPQTERIKELYGGLGDSMADVSINLTKLTADMASFYNEEYADVAEDLQSVFTGMTRPLRKYGLDLTQATLKEWALANGLDADISKMSQAEKTMLRYQYVMANMGHVMGDFTKTADTWANVTRTIGQQFQKMGQLIGEALINTFKPYLIAFRDFMNNLIGLTEKALNAIGKLLGWQVEIERVGTTLDEDAEDYADSLDDAAGSAKKLKAYLLGIDELNTLPSKNDSGSGSGTGGSGLGAGSNVDYSGKFEVKKYESDIDSWYEFGKRISDKIREALGDIDWEKTFEKARSFGTNLAEFLNGLISPDTFYKVGETIANSMNTVLYGALDFAKTFDWKNAGVSLGSAINGWLEHYDFKATGEAITTFANGILTWATNAINTVNWEQAGQDLIDLFMGIDWTTLETNLYELTRAIFSAIVEATKGAVQKAKEDPEAFGELALSFTRIALFLGAIPLTKAILANEIKKFITKLLGATAAKSTASGAAAGGLGSLGVLSLTLAIALVWDYKSGNMGKRVDKFKEGLSKDAKTAAQKENAENYAARIGTSYTPETANVATDMYAVQTIINAIKDKFRKHSGGGHEFYDLGEETTAGIFEGMALEAASSAQSKADYIFGETKKAIETSAGIDSPAKNMYDVGENIVKGIYEGFGLVDFMSLMNQWWKTNVTPWFTREKWVQITSGVKLGIVNTLTATATSVAQIWNNIKQTASTTWENIKQVIQKAIDAIKGFMKFDWKLPDIKTPHLSWVSGGSEATGVVKTILEALSLPTSIPKLKVDWYAQGGFPETGSLFVAREAGAELVGNIGGHTAVANNMQIVEAVSQGVASAVASVLGSGRGNQTIQMVVDGKVLYQTVVNENNRQISRTGASAIRA